MRRRPAVRRGRAAAAAALTAAALVGAGALPAAGTAAAAPEPVVPSTGLEIVSPNVTHLGTVPLDGAAVSMKVVKVGTQVRAFVSGAGGLSIYDATDPAHPTLLGHLPIYNWENEDIAVSKDGKTAVLTEFEGTLYLHVVDVSNPRLPVLKGTLAPGGAHTVVCADPACGYLYGSEGQTYDIRDRAHPKEVPAERSWGVLTRSKPGHNLHQDATGVWIADTEPLTVFRQTTDPLHVKVLTRGTITKNTGYQHNNIRTRAARYVPRKAGESLGGPLRPGELLLGNGETNFTGTCDSGSGAFSTWSMAGFDRGAPLKQLSVLRPVSGNYTGGDPAVNELGCSGHWFTQKDARDGSILVTAAWYEHGTRFLKVNPKTGAIRQVGYFQPVRGAASLSYWMPNSDIVWTVDYHSGIDILRFNQSGTVPTTAQTDASWLSTLVEDPFLDALQALCKAGAASTATQHAELHHAAPAAFDAFAPPGSR